MSSCYRRSSVRALSRRLNCAAPFKLRRGWSRDRFLDARVEQRERQVVRRERPARQHLLVQGHGRERFERDQRQHAGQQPAAGADGVDGQLRRRRDRVRGRVRRRERVHGPAVLDRGGVRQPRRLRVPDPAADVRAAADDAKPVRRLRQNTTSCYSFPYVREPARRQHRSHDADAGDLAVQHVLGVDDPAPAQIVGLQWQVNSTSGMCTVELRLDDIAFIPAAPPPAPATTADASDYCRRCALPRSIASTAGILLETPRN